MFKLKPKYFENIVVSGFPSLGNQLSIIAMLFFHNYQALKYGRVDGLAAYLYRRGRIARFAFDDRAGTRGCSRWSPIFTAAAVTAGRTLSATWAIIPLSDWELC